jgi:membrane protease YdiL (CAAX protease family)
MTILAEQTTDRHQTTVFPPSWYPDPWRIAPLRWWDGNQWTPVLYGPYGEAWPLTATPPLPFEPKGPGIKGGGIAAIGAGVGFVASFCVVIAFAIGSGGTVDVNSPWLLLASQLGLWFGFVGAVVTASWKNGSRSLAADYGLSWPRIKDLWSGLLSGIAGRVVPLIILVLAVAGGTGFAARRGVTPSVLGTTPTSTTGWLMVIILAVVGAPVVEELFFRGLLQGAFTRRVGAIPAIFITALMFSFAHIFNEGPLAPIILFPAALLLGYLRHRTGRLAAGMVAHATFNATMFLLLLVPAFR